jgi:hypothetical protein
MIRGRGRGGSKGRKGQHTIIPKLSPQDTIQKQLKKHTKNICFVLGNPAAKSVNTAKTKLVPISNGTSRVIYCIKNASTPYVPSSFSL